MEGCSLHGAALNDARLLVPGSCKDLLGNRMVVIRHKGSDQSVSLADPDTLLTALGETPLVIGDPAHVPAGVYDREALLRRRECERPVFHRQRSGEIKGCAKILRRFIDGHPQFRRRVSPSPGLLLKSSVVLHSGTGEKKSPNHPNAKVWKMRCEHCGHMYGANSCDWHIRKCPRCQGGQPGFDI